MELKKMREMTEAELNAELLKMKKSHLNTLSLLHLMKELLLQLQKQLLKQQKEQVQEYLVQSHSQLKKK